MQSCFLAYLNISCFVLLTFLLPSPSSDLKVPYLNVEHKILTRNVQLFGQTLHSSKVLCKRINFQKRDQTNSIFSNSDDYAALCLLTAWLAPFSAYNYVIVGGWLLGILVNT